MILVNHHLYETMMIAVHSLFIYNQDIDHIGYILMDIFKAYNSSDTVNREENDDLKQIYLRLMSMPMIQVFFWLFRSVHFKLPVVSLCFRCQV